MTTDPTRATLRRIAATLNVPTETFLRPPPSGGTAPSARQQTLALLEAFAEVEDPQDREACLAFVRARRRNPGA
jgi:hypothetical protein